MQPSYDRFTRWFSFGMDARWKRTMREAVARHAPGPRHLDLATGTGDLLAADSIGLDCSLAMLRGARGRDRRVKLVGGDILRLPLRDESVDAITAAYAFRNVESAGAALEEAGRVLVPGGVLVTLDFYRPEVGWWRAVFERYLAAAGSVAGWIAHRDPATYGYIARSLTSWMTVPDFALRLQASGLAVREGHRFVGGGIAMHVAVKVCRQATRSAG